MKPYLFKSKEDITIDKIRKLPVVSGTEINGYEYIQNYFVDSSGFGQEDECALTFPTFIKQIKVGYAYGITSYGQFQVNIGEFKPNKEKVFNNEVELEPRYDSRKSFYKKAYVINEKGVLKLRSYNTIVCEIKDKKPVVFGEYSQTTLRHIKEFLKQNGFKANNIKQVKSYLLP